MGQLEIEDLNDDVYHIILSYLPFSDLNHLTLVSRNNFRISQLAASDKYHENNYVQKIKRFAKLYQWKFDFEKYLQFKNDYRLKLIELRTKIDELIAENYSKQLAALNTQFDFPVKKLYRSFKDIKSLFNNEDILNLKNDSLKLIFCGEGAVGKTCLIYRLYYGEMPAYVTTLDVREIKYIAPISLLLWDTPGQEDYDRLRPLSYPSTDVFCICFSRTRPESFCKIPSRWLPEINHHLPNSALVLVGCKSDLLEKSEKELLIFDKFVSYEHSVQMARNIGAITYIETSSLTGEGNISDFAEILTKSYVFSKQINILDKSKKKCIIC